MHRPTRLRLAGLAAALVAVSAGSLMPALAGASAAPAPAAPPAVAHDHRSHDHTVAGEGCEPVAGGAVLCSHADVPPPGVDIDRLPSVRELRQREGAAEAALDAAQDSGVPAPVQVAAGSTVPCDGDGTSGPRVQAMYVVAADRTNRFAALQSSIVTWAAGVEDVVNRSAAQTGGVRSVRYVHGPSVSGACTPTVLNVTVPAGANASFSSTITAVRNQGFTDPSRKYLMWVDATGLCGIANMYLDDRPGQDNVNNGSFPMYSRTDAPCWGHALSVEAHELLHNLGGVQRSAPRSTANGHCTDDHDRMCYVDGSGVTMSKVCAPENEALLDCRNDDYFLAGTPAAGSYLATHWNTASSRFLIAGSGGSGGGTPPSGLTVTIAVNSPGIAGLPTQVTATAQDVPGRNTTFAWTSSRRDCAFADATARQTTVTCSAASSSAATVTVTASNGVTTPVRASSPMTFSTTARTAALTSSVDGTSGAGPVTACPRSVLPVTAKVVDAVSGTPVRGLTVQFVQTLAGRVSLLGSAVTGVKGTAAGRVVAVDGASVSARTIPSGAFPSRSSDATALSAAAPCETTLAAALEADAVGYGAPVVVTGSVTRSSTSAPVGGARVSLAFTPTGSATSTVVATATAGGDGAFRLTGALTTSGTLTVRYAATPTYGASAGAPLAVTVSPYTTSVTTSLSSTSVTSGQALTVTGTLFRTTAGSTTPAARRTVVVRQLNAAGSVVRQVAVTTGVDGSYTAVLRPLVSGSVVVTSAAAPGYAASTGDAQGFTVTT